MRIEQKNSRLKKLVADLSLEMPFSKRPHGETSKPIEETQDSIPVS
jgi:hypothetical protein